MDTGDESVVEGANAVCCQEEDTLAIFHRAEEACGNVFSISMVLGNTV